MRIVNILNEGYIPWIKINGPVFGYELSEGMFFLLMKDKSIMMELTTPREALKQKEEYYNKKRKVEEIKDTIQITDSVPTSEEVNDMVVITPVVKNDTDDDEIDKILEEHMDDNPDFIPAEKVVVKKYSRRQLSVMTKREMKDILKERGYLEGPFAGKYHDTVAKLIDKVLQTQ